MIPECWLHLLDFTLYRILLWAFFLYILLATNVMITERQTLNDIHENTVILTRIPSVIREYRYGMG